MIQTLIPAGHTLLPCGCVVPSRTGELARCPERHDPDTPDYHRTAPKPYGR
jgi:hypothetical protein